MIASIGATSPPISSNSDSGRGKGRHLAPAASLELGKLSPFQAGQVKSALPGVGNDLPLFHRQGADDGVEVLPVNLPGVVDWDRLGMEFEPLDRRLAVIDRCILNEPWSRFSTCFLRQIGNLPHRRWLIFNAMINKVSHARCKREPVACLTSLIR